MSTVAAARKLVAVGSEQTVGTFYPTFDDEVPYDRMWADDPVWLPGLLRTGGSFAGHFVFDGGPGAASKVKEHNYRKLGA